MIKITFKLLISAIALTQGASAWAQWNTMNIVGNMVQNDTTRSQLNSMNNNIIRNQNGQNDKAPPQVVVDVKQLKFISDPARTHKNVANFAANMRKVGDGKTAEELEQNGVAIMGQISQAIRSVGLDATNLADAYALWWVSSWRAANQKDTDSSRGLYQAVKKQAQEALSITPELIGSSHAQKQELAESLLLQTVLIDASVSAAEGNPAQQGALAKAVNQGAKKMGLDLTKMTLTEDGFVPRSGGRSDASDGAGGEQLAANDSGTAADDASLGHYALYAAAGTGLLAGVFALGKGLSKRG